MIYDLIIIGAGPAGMTAAIYAKRANLNILIFEKSAPGGQIVNTAFVENYPGLQKLGGYELATLMLSHLEEFNIDITYEEVLDIKDLGNQKLVTSESSEYYTKAVIIATGNVPRRLNIPLEEELSGTGISWCAICDGPFYKGARVAVIGGGNSAVEEAAYLASIAREVTVIQDKDKLTADQVAIDNLKKYPHVHYKFNSRATKFISENNELTGVEIINDKGESEVILVDGVFEYIGLIPATKFASNLGILNEYGYVIVDAKMQSKVPGIYGAGDVTNKQIRQIVTATSDGAVAVQNVLKYLESL